MTVVSLRGQKPRTGAGFATEERKTWQSPESQSGGVAVGARRRCGQPQLLAINVAARDTNDALITD